MVMAVELLEEVLVADEFGSLPPFIKKDSRMYAIAFDMDIEALKNHYGDPDNNAYAEIRRVLQKQGFS